MLRPSSALLRVGAATGESLREARGVSTEQETLQRERYGHFVAGVLAWTTRAVGPDLERELLLFHHSKAKSHEEQGFARQPEDLIQAERARIHEQGFHERLADAAPLLVVPHGESRDLREPGAVDFEAARADQTPVGCLGHDVLLDVPAQVIVRARQEISAGDEGSHQHLHRCHISERGGAKLRRGSYGQAGQASTSSRIVAPRSSSSRVIVSGGTMRMTFGPAVSTSRWRSRAAATNGAAASVSSRPHISPRPLASFTRALRVASAPSRAPNHSPLARTAARNSGSAIVRTTSSATVATNGPPPNVVAWSPGASAAAIASSTRITPIGSPPPSGFASVYISGTTPEGSAANSVPVRPRPHCTSSKINAVPVSLHRFRKKTRNSSATLRTPPSPCTGSMMTAAVRSFVIARVAASMSPSGMICTPPSSGSNGRR